jgi:hypothetical protein
MLRAGATCVDLYSAFIYQGWSVARRINLELASLLRQHNTAEHAADTVTGAGWAAAHRIARLDRSDKSASENDPVRRHPILVAPNENNSSRGGDPFQPAAR